MAGDNNLEDSALDDLQELKKVGSSSKVDVFVQLDTMRDDVTRRYHVRSGSSIKEDLVSELGETNTGDPAVAIDFFKWGISQSPAKRVLAVIWNHGSGIDETDVYRRAVRRGLTIGRRVAPAARSVPRRRLRAALSRRFRTALFSRTVERALHSAGPGRRAIAYDDSARDFLDNLELEKVLVAVQRKLGRKIDLVGFDACLMNMIEIGYQLRDTTSFIVGSQEVEPGDGWPYDRILRDLTARPTMTAGELGSSIVRHYVESYSGDAVTQSLLDLSAAPAVAKAVDQLAGALIDALRACEFPAVLQAVRHAQRYDMKDFLDLGDLARRLAAGCRSKNVKSAGKAVIDVIRDGFVSAEGHTGAALGSSSGVSIYCPVIVQEAKLIYRRLDFAKDTRWDEFLDACDRA